MANSFFGTADFYVVADNRGFWPGPQRDADRIKHYRATVIPFSESQYKTLLNNVSTYTALRGIGSDDFSFIIDTGPEPVELRVPVNAGNRGSFQAILVDISGKMLGNRPGHFECVCDWVITSDDITPV